MFVFCLFTACLMKQNKKVDANSRWGRLVYGQKWWKISFFAGKIRPISPRKESSRPSSPKKDHMNSSRPQSPRKEPKPQTRSVETETAADKRGSHSAVRCLQTGTTGLVTKVTATAGPYVNAKRNTWILFSFNAFKAKYPLKKVVFGYVSCCGFHDKGVKSQAISEFQKLSLSKRS